jgi:hypothetical protein
MLMPDPVLSSGPLAWLTYQGRWGERQPWEFNGPKGPNLGKKWTDPMGAISDWRPSSLADTHVRLPLDAELGLVEGADAAEGGHPLQGPSRVVSPRRGRPLCG